MGVAVSNIATVAAGAVLAIQPAAGQETLIRAVGSDQWIPKVFGEINAAVAAAAAVDFQPDAGDEWEVRGLGGSVRLAVILGPDIDVDLNDGVNASRIFAAGEVFDANGECVGLALTNGHYLTVTNSAAALASDIGINAKSLRLTTPNVTLRITNGVLTSNILNPGRPGPWGKLKVLVTNGMYAEIVNEAAVPAVIAYSALKAA